MRNRKTKFLSGLVTLMMTLSLCASNVSAADSGAAFPPADAKEITPDNFLDSSAAQGSWYRFTADSDAMVGLYADSANSNKYVSAYLGIFDASGNTMIAKAIANTMTDNGDQTAGMGVLDQEDGTADELYSFKVSAGTYYIYGGKDFAGLSKFTVTPINADTSSNGLNFEIKVTSNGRGDAASGSEDFAYPAGMTESTFPAVETKYDESIFSFVQLMTYEDCFRITYNIGNSETRTYGAYPIDLVDESGRTVGTVTGKEVPKAPGHVSSVKGTTDTMAVLCDSLYSDSAKVYIKKGSDYTYFGTYPVYNHSSITITGLKPNSDYFFKLSNYQEEGDLESDLSDECVGITASDVKPVIQKVGKVKISRCKGIHEKSDIWKTKTTYYYWEANASVTLGKKIPKTSDYEYSPNNQRRGSLLTLATTKNVDKKTALPKKVQLKVRQVRKKSTGNSTAVAYGPWSKAKTVKIR